MGVVKPNAMMLKRPVESNIHAKLKGNIQQMVVIVSLSDLEKMTGGPDVTRFQYCGLEIEGKVEMEENVEMEEKVEMLSKQAANHLRACLTWQLPEVKESMSNVKGNCELCGSDSSWYYFLQVSGL